MSVSDFVQPSARVFCMPHAPRLHSIVQIACRQRAALAALALPVGQRRRLRLQLACARTRTTGEQAKREGKIKGPTRDRPQSQSARGLGAARHLAVLVPCGNARSHACEPCSALPLIECAVLRWSSLHGQA
jgi:hypothetical protein